MSADSGLDDPGLVKETVMLDYVIKFGNPVFRPGINLTVRKGKKWLGAELRGYGHMPRGRYEIMGPDEIIDGEIEVLETRVRPFNYLVGAFGILSFEHDPDCHNFAGLLTDMRRAYGETFTKKDEVTLVFFRVVTSLDIQLIDLVEDSYQCLKCSKRFRDSEVKVSCVEGHSPGQCCHLGETEVGQEEEAKCTLKTFY